MSELFPKQNVKTKEEQANEAFTKSYREMTDEIDRVASEPVSIWAILTKWIYGKIFGDPDHLKAKQDTKDKFRLAQAFQKMKKTFEPEPSDSMTNDEIMEHAQRKFDGK